VNRRLFSVAAAVSLVLCVITLLSWAWERVRWSWTRRSPLFEAVKPRWEIVAESDRFFDRGVALRYIAPVQTPVFGPPKFNADGTPGLNPAFQQWLSSLEGPRIALPGFRFARAGWASGNDDKGYQCVARTYEVWAPFWSLCLITLLIPAAWARRRVAESRRGRRALRGLCPRCGYDLRATPDLCPECGRKARPDPAEGATA
jgi:hypothetical protein